MLEVKHRRQSRRVPEKTLIWRISCFISVMLLLSVSLSSVDGLTQTAHAAGRVPVIIIPGVAGSTFTTTQSFSYNDPDNGHGGTYQHTYGANENVWVNVWEAALPGSDDYFDVMRIGADADTPAAPYSKLRVSGLYNDGYKDLLDYLRRLGYVDNVTLFTFAYDWRRDIPRATFENLDALINQALASAGTTQVDIIGHSMGGLVGRNYISTSSQTNAKVRRLITFGTPYLGAPKFFKALVYGDQFGPSFLGLGLNPDEVKDLVQNMSGGWQLLPSRLYYNFYNNASSQLLSPYREDRDVDGDGRASGAMSYDGVTTFLRNLGKNQNAFNFAQNFHNRLDNSWPGGSTRISFINGAGLGTVGQIRDYTGTCWSWFRYYPCPKTDVLSVDGDGTVPYYSASLYDTSRGINLSGNASLHTINREHGALVQYDYTLGIKTGDGAGLTLLGQILNNTVDPLDMTTRAMSIPNDMQTFKAQPRLTGYAISVTNQVTVEVIDEKGRRTGKKSDDDHKNEQTIPGSIFEIVGDTRYVYIPEGSDYSLRLTATSSGSFDLKIRVLDGEETKLTALFLNVETNKGDKAELQLNSTKDNEKAGRLRLNTGQGKKLSPSAVLDAKASADIEAPSITLEKPSQDKSGRVEISWEATDRLSGLYLQQATIDPDSNAAQMVEKGQRLRLTPGTHVLQVIAQDKAGNANLKELKFTIS